MLINENDPIKVTEQHNRDTMTVCIAVENFYSRHHDILNEFVVAGLWLELIGANEVGVKTLLNLCDHKLGCT